VVPAPLGVYPLRTTDGEQIRLIQVVDGGWILVAMRVEPGCDRFARLAADEIEGGEAAVREQMPETGQWSLTPDTVCPWDESITASSMRRTRKESVGSVGELADAFEPLSGL